MILDEKNCVQVFFSDYPKCVIICITTVLSFFLRIYIFIFLIKNVYYFLPLILGDFSDIRASPTCLLTPVFVPPVKIHAPVVLGTIHISRKHIFRLFMTPLPLHKHAFGTGSRQKLRFSNLLSPLKVLT